MGGTGYRQSKECGSGQGKRKPNRRRGWKGKSLSLPDHVPVGVLVSSGLHGRNHTLLKPGFALDALMERQEEVKVLLLVPGRHVGDEDSGDAVLEDGDR